MSPDNIEEYLQKNQGEASGYLYSNFKGLFGVKDFPDFSDTILKERLIKRNTETDADLKKRIERAEMELSFKDQFDYVVSNVNLEEARWLNQPYFYNTPIFWESLTEEDMKFLESEIKNEIKFSEASHEK